jgi:hypothetical protein
MISPTVPRPVYRSIGVAVMVLTFAACRDSDRPPPARDHDIDLADLVGYDASAPDTRNIFASGGCDNGAVQECRIYLPKHNGVQPCFVGQQVCSGTEWGECGNGTLVDANAGDAELDPDTLSPP